MKFALSTNWCAKPATSGEEIADKALELGFDALELGFSTTAEQAEGFARRLDQIPVGSVHAFCPVPLSAPQGYPELYRLACADEDERALARFHIRKNVEFAASLGADVVVLHAGRVGFATFFRRGFDSMALQHVLEECKKDVSAPAYAKALARAKKTRAARGAEMMEVFRRELEALAPVLDKNGVTLALENLPYLEGFPDESEMAQIAAEFSGARIRPWFDTGHHRVRECRGYVAPGSAPAPGSCAGMHLNDVADCYDDHLAPGEGKVDFAALAPLARSAGHVVLEPKSHVTPERLAAGLALVRGLWRDDGEGSAR